MAINVRARKRRLLTLVLVATALVAGMALTPMAAKAVHDEALFELDGNIADDPRVAGQDWSGFQGPVAPGDTTPVSTVFISDGFNGVNDSTYFGGGSQNNNDISSWGWSCGSVSTKSDIEHAFASAYIKSDQLFLYFGGDRYDPAGGTTSIGFWFLQNGGALQGGSGCPDDDPATNTFSGQHVDGDLFVFAEFVGGGGDSGVSIYEWLNGSLKLLAAKSSGSFCSSDDSICALSNNETIASTWPYTDNQGSSADGQILQGGFVEGGINLSSIYKGLGKDLPCVNRFLAQTGSSHPDTGVLEDFAGGSFNVCSKLIVDKITPSGDQTKFPFSVAGPAGYSDSFQLSSGDTPHDSEQIKSGTYMVTETPGDPNVWKAPSVTCKDQGNNAVGYTNGAVSIAPGATVTCTFTNSKKPQLNVIKKIVGGNGTSDSFDVHADGGAKIDDATSTDPAGTSSGAFAVSAGPHTVTETLGDGSTPVSPSDWEVSFSGDCDSSGDVDVQNDESKTCTITNSKLPKLTVVKQIEGGNGSSFDISVGQTKVLDDAGDGASDERTYTPGNYAVTETFGNGEAIGADWTVVYSGGCAPDRNVSLAYGDDKTCTITNKRKPKLTVVKQIEGGNGAGFDLKVNDSTVLDDVDGTGGQASNTYPVDTAYTVTETLANGDPVDPALWETTTSGNCSGTLAAGDDKTCTITNKRKPKLTVVKQILGGDGSSFDISVGATKVLDDAGDGSTDTRTYDPGTYAITETLGTGGPVPAGWSTSYSSSCAQGSVTLGYGDAKTCTLTNSKLPRLVVIKNVVGGAKSPGDFQMSVSGNGPSPSSFSGSAEGSVVSLEPGRYDVSEGEDSHYSASYSADCKDGSIAYGESKTCTITNTRKPSSVTIDKVASPTSVPEPGGNVTFTFRVHNPSPADTVTIDALTDSVYGDLFLKGDCDALEHKELAPDDGAAGGPDETTCSFIATVSGNAGDSHHNVARVTGHDEDERPVTAGDFADVELTDVAPSIDVTKIADPITVAEPGGPVEFTVHVKNTSVSTDPVRITSLVDDPDGVGPAEPIDLNGKGSCSVPQVIRPSETYTCKFTRMITGNAGEVKIDVVTAVGHDDDGHSVSDHDDAEVTITDVASSITVDKSATPSSVQEPGGDVAFTVVIKNTSAADAVTIDTVVDSIYGNLATKGTCDTLIGKVLQRDDHAASGSDEATCTFTGLVTGSAGSTHTNVVTVTGHDDDAHSLTAHDDATVTITPAPVVPKLIDLYVTKTDLPDPVQLNGQLTYTIVVGNNGPDAATQVTLADPLPAGTSFVSVSTTQGTCTGDVLISCNLGTVPVGSTVTITLVVTAQQTGVLTNTVTVVGKEPEASTANNQATATTTLVPTPLVRQTKELVCDTFTVTPKSLRVGKRATIVVHVTGGGKPVKGRKVIVKGAGILKSGRTNARGVVRIAVNPRRPGIVTITVPQKLTCGNKRIGVVGAFETRFTG